MALVTGTQLGPYEIIGPLGTGGMGEVYRARDSRLRRDVAIKVLSQRLTNSADAMRRFEREAKVVAHLSHPNILSIHDVGTDQGVYYAVTELLDGETLRSRITRSAIPWRKAAEIGIAVSEGLSVAHARGIIHRDLKPENIFLTKDGRVKILDFGLAHIESRPNPDLTQLETVVQQADTDKQDAAGSRSETAMFQTDPGTVMGTVGYMAPEQVRGQPVDARSDIFSLGCILYEMASGQRAFARETAAETMTAALKEDPIELTESGKRIPPEFCRVIMHCLEKNPEERFQSARDLAFDLKAIQTGSEITRPAPARATVSFRPALWLGLSVAIALAVGAAIYFMPRPDNEGESRPSPNPVRTIQSVAVLPFVNDGADADAEYLSDGITESIINSLSQATNLKVKSRSSVFRYKGKETDILKVARELGVQAIVTGRVLQRDEGLSISIELVDARDNTHIWGGHYNRKLSDVLAVQEQIAHEITDKLRLQLTGDEKRRLSKRHTSNSLAYQAYLKGRYHWNKRTADGFRKGIEYFEEAIQHDPDYAVAYAGLADCYGLLAGYTVEPPTEANPKAKRAAERALQLDDSLADAYALLAYIRQRYDWDWAAAEREFLRAIELDPNYATAHHWYAYLLMQLARWDEAAGRIKRAQELDPLSLIINANVGYRWYLAREYDKALEQYQKTLDMDASFAVTHYYFGLAYEQKGERQKALASFNTAVNLAGGNTEFVAGYAHGLATSGETDEARKMLANLIEQSKNRYIPPFHIALVYRGLGETEATFDWLERSYTERDGFLTYLKVDPRLDAIRAEPRFAHLLRRVGLAP